MKRRWGYAAVAVLAIAGAHLLDGWAFEHLRSPRLAETDLGRMLRVLGFLPLWIIVAAALILSADRGDRGPTGEPGTPQPQKLARRWQWRRGWLLAGSAQKLEHRRRWRRGWLVADSPQKREHRRRWRRCWLLADSLQKPEHRRRWRRGWLVAGSATLGGLVAEIAKILIRRERPADGVTGYTFRAWTDGTFHTGGLGLPSSHALVALAALAMLGILFPRARPLWWLLGAGCAYGRVAAGAHFLSDVVVAAVAGWLVALLLARLFPEPVVEAGHIAGDEGAFGRTPPPHS